MIPTAPSSGPDSALSWFKSSHSSNDGPDCVEVAIAAHGTGGATVHVRDSKDVDGARLAFPDGVWSTFVGFAGREQRIRG
ncbi:DUF397 domain-containing protein [Streptomyces populi]|uniref:DUF397 domain-containing protein n=1 Tax=Streptomyces populi TaxID=2058924 RepID=UPI0035D780DA